MPHRPLYKHLHRKRFGRKLEKFLYTLYNKLYFKNKKSLTEDFVNHFVLCLTLLVEEKFASTVPVHQQNFTRTRSQKDEKHETKEKSNFV